MAIRILPEILINQIAAGEVVERPASVLKELVENALDAGARAIEVDLEQGGVTLVRVSDDGVGMSADQLPLALTRHATSKISDLDDLEAVGTLGFRGEALPSIGSVARLTMTSRTAGCAHGWKIEVQGGRVGEVEPAAARVGTRVEVRDLFHLVPARRKFLKTERTEYSRCEEYLKALALARPTVAIRLTHNGRPCWQAMPADDNAESVRRLGAVIGSELAAQCLHLQHSIGGLALHGWVAPATAARSQADLQFFFVNGRYVRDRLVSHAVRQAFADVLYHGRHPVYVLHLTLDPARVDVNVHPAKHEVRFRDGRSVHDFLYRSLYEALADQRPGDRPSPADSPASAPSGGWQFGPQGGLSLNQVRERLQAYGQLFGDQRSDGSGTTDGNAEVVATALPAWAPSTVAGHANSATANPSLTDLETAQVPPLGFALAQLAGVYILAQNAHGLVIVDMHAAHERITYERLKQAADAGEQRSQALLVPRVVAVSAREAELAESESAAFADLGFDLARAGPESVALRSVPEALAGVDMDALLRDLLADLKERGSLARAAERRNELLSTAACHGSVMSTHATGAVAIPVMARTKS